MDRRRVILGTLLLTCLAPASALAQSAWLKELTLDPNLPERAKQRFSNAFGILNRALATYGVAPRTPIHIIVTANGQSFIQALVNYGGFTREEAEERVNSGTRRGVSISKRAVIIIRWVPSRVQNDQGAWVEADNPEDVFFALPHEVFHQVQDTYDLSGVGQWLKEGPAHLFQFKVLEMASLRSITESIRAFEDAYRRRRQQLAPSELISMDAVTFMARADAGYPCYDMATLMAGKLVRDGGLAPVLRFYGLVNDGAAIESAFFAAFGVTSADFAASAATYLGSL